MDDTTFIGAVFDLRVSRLRIDAKDMRLDEATRRECAFGIALLSLMREEMMI